MKDRIQVDGVWYVRETSTLPIVEIDEMLVTNYFRLYLGIR
jgi:hypothetical protein